MQNKLYLIELNKKYFRPNDIYSTKGNISKAKKLLREHKGEAIQSLEKLLSEAENKLEHESPKESFEIADSIPLQISSVEGNAEIANELILVVEQKMQESEGLNLELWNENLERAKNAIEKGDYNLGRGLAESILRDLIVISLRLPIGVATMYNPF